MFFDHNKLANATFVGLAVLATLAVWAFAVNVWMWIL